MPFAVQFDLLHIICVQFLYLWTYAESMKTKRKKMKKMNWKIIRIHMMYGERRSERKFHFKNYHLNGQLFSQIYLF